MYKKFLNAILFGALILGSAGTITSCKDYDDEIDEINQKLNTMTQKDELNAQIASLSSAISAAQSAASQAATEAANALAAAKEAAATASQAVSTATGASGQSGEAFAAAKDAAAAAETAAVNTAAAAKSAASAAAEAKKAAESGAGSAASAEKAQAAATAAQAAAAEASKNAAAATDAAQVSSKKAADAAASAAAAEGTAKEVQEAAAAAAAAQAALAQAAAADAKKAEASAQSAASEAANAAAQAAAAAGDAKAAAASADAAKKASEAADKAATASQAASAASAAEAKASAASSAAAKASAAAAQTDAAAAKASAAASAAKADEAAKKATEAAKSASDSAAAAASAKDDAAAAKQAATDSAKAAKDASDAATDAKNNADLAKAASEAAASSASDAAKEAKKAADDLQKALDSLEEVANTAAQKAAEDAKEAALKAIQSKLDDLQTEIDQKTDQSITEDMITEWNDKLDALKAEFSMKLGHRLTSLSVIPTTHVNGIAAITLTTLRYIPQEYLEWDEHGRGLQDGRWHNANRPILDHIALGWDAEEDDEKVVPVYISSEKNEAFYHVTPNNGVRKQDIKLPLFDNIISNNVTRADVDVVENSPLAPTDWDINNNILKVTFKKTTTEQIGSIGRPHRVQGGYLHAENDAENDVEQIALKRNEEKFYMVSLRAPIAEENLMEDENEAFVNSEYVRVEEIIKEPYIAHNKADFTKPIRADYFADETQATEDPEVGDDNPNAPGKNLFVHYHDSVCIYKSEVDEYVDILAAYNKELDLKKWVTVCLTDNFLDDHSTHEKLENYADYGLGFRFYIAEAPYITLGGPQNNSLRTDQQQFAEIKDAKKGIMTSKVYTIDGDPNQTSVGREPIVRVELWDEANGNLIAIRYIKVKWVLDLGKIEVPYTFDPGLFACGPYQSVIGTEEMNTKIYSQIGENGMTKAIFHATYRDNGFTDDGSDYGTVSLRRNTESNVESYNIVWTLSHADIVSMIVKNYGTATWQWEAWKASGEPLKFTKTFYWKSSIAPSLEFTLTREIYPEDLDVFGYLQTYWRKNTDYSVFNVNPVVYNTQEPNPAWNIPQGANTNGGRNNPTNNIYTDLLNGFLDDLGVKPMTGADGVIYFTTTSDMQIGTNPYIYKAGKKYYYAEEYGLTDATTGAEGVSRKDDVYQWFYKEGVRFTFDEDKLNDDTHTYYYYDVVSGTYKKGYAYVVNNDGKSPELWISASKTDTQSFNQRAATIVNYQPNLRNAQELTYNIKLEEARPNHQPFAGPQPTEAAKALVGNYVPIKFVADLCEDGNEIHPEGASYPHTDVVKAYDAFIIEPLKPMVVDADAFTDATIGGSTIGVQGMNVYQSWNADAHGNYYPVMDGQIPGTVVELLGVWGGSGPRWAIHQYIRDEYIDKGYTEQEANEVAMLAYQLGRYYEATSVVWDTDNIKTNLKLEGGNLVADPDLKPADDLSNWSSLRSLPSNVTITYNGADQTLTYFNQDGTPVNINYNVFIPVTYGYKWKTMVGYVAVEVNSNAGTDDNQ